MNDPVHPEITRLTFSRQADVKQPAPPLRKAGDFLRRLWDGPEPPKENAVPDAASLQAAGSETQAQETALSLPHSEVPAAPRGWSRLRKGTTVRGQLCTPESIEVEGAMEGPLKSGGGVLVSGRVEGNITCAGQFRIAPGGEVHGDVTCGSAELCGNLTGNLHVSGCATLLDRADVNGDLTTGSLRTAAGARIHGRLSVGTPAGTLPGKVRQSENPLPHP